MERWLKSLLVSWLTGQLFGEKTTLPQTAARSTRRRVNSLKPRNVARREVRRALRKLL